MQGKQLKNFVSLRTSAFNQNLKDHIEAKLKENKKASITGIIIDLAQKGLTLSETGEKTSLPTGIIIECPIRPTQIPICAWCDTCINVVYMKAKVDSSVCKTCKRYPCETWETIISDKGLSDKRTIKKTDLQQRIETVHSLT